MKESRKWQYCMYVKGNIKAILHIATGGFLVLGEYEKMVLTLMSTFILDFLGLEFYRRFHENLIKESIKP